MPLEFPPNPPLDTVVDDPVSGLSWRWDLVKWIPIPEGTVGGPFLPLAGGQMLGQILTLPPVALPDAANKEYVDAMIASMTRFTSTYAVETNIPDLTVPPNTPPPLGSGAYYVVTVTPPATYAPTIVDIPGIPLGTVLHNSDYLIWSGARGLYELLQGGEVTLDEADARYVIKTGDTMTGPLIITSTQASLFLGSTGTADTYLSLAILNAGFPSYRLYIGGLTGRFEFTENINPDPIWSYDYVSTIFRFGRMVELLADPVNPLEAATKQYVDLKVAPLVHFLGPWDVATTPTPGPGVNAGDYWRVSVGGTVAAGVPGIGGMTLFPGDVVVWSPAQAAWQLVVGSQGSAGQVFTGDAPPASPVDGDLWWDSANAQLYVWYEDVDSGQWVITINQGGGGSAPSGAREVLFNSAEVAILDTVSTGAHQVSVFDLPAGKLANVGDRIHVTTWCHISTEFSTGAGTCTVNWGSDAAPAFYSSITGGSVIRFGAEFDIVKTGPSTQMLCGYEIAWVSGGGGSDYMRTYDYSEDDTAVIPISYNVNITPGQAFVAQRQYQLIEYFPA